MDVIANGPPPRRPLPRWLRRTALAALVLGGLVVAYVQQGHPTSPPAGGPTPTRSAAAPARTYAQPPVDDRPVAGTAALRERAAEILGTPSDASVGSLDVVGSAYRNGTQSTGFGEDVAVPGELRIDLVCEGTGALMVHVQDDTSSAPAPVASTALACGHGHVTALTVTVRGTKVFLFAAPDPTTVGVLGYAVHAPGATAR